MNKTELIAAMAENSGLTKKDCERLSPPLPAQWKPP